MRRIMAPPARLSLFSPGRRARIAIILLAPAREGLGRGGEAMPQGQSPVGVLFVHGIGTQRKGETLASFGGALYRWLELAKFRGGDDRVGRVRLEDARLVVPEDPGAPAHARL